MCPRQCVNGITVWGKAKDTYDLHNAEPVSLHQPQEIHWNYYRNDHGSRNQVHTMPSVKRGNEQCGLSKFIAYMGEVPVGQRANIHLCMKYPLFIKRVMNLYGKEKISIHIVYKVATANCCHTSIWPAIILNIHSLTTRKYWGVSRYCPMCRLQMSWWVLQYQAICHYIVDSFSVTQKNENYYYWLDHRLKGKDTRPLIEFSDFTVITNQCTYLSMPTINT